MDWVKVALLLMQIANSIINGVRARRELQAGEDKALREAGESIMRQSAAGKRIMEQIDAMPPAERDRLTDALGSARMQ